MEVHLQVTISLSFIWSEFKGKTKIDEKQELLNDLTPLYQGKYKNVN